MDRRVDVGDVKDPDCPCGGAKPPFLKTYRKLVERLYGWLITSRTGFDPQTCYQPLTFEVKMRLKLTTHVLALLIGLFASPVFAKSPDICSNQVDNVMEWTVAKMQGLTKEMMLEMLDFSNVPEGYQDQLKAEILEAIDLIWESEGTPLEKGKQWFLKCLNSPDYVEKTSI